MAFGSPRIFQMFREISAAQGKKKHALLLASLSGESNLEDTYGRMFESFCHPMLQKGCTLSIRNLVENGAAEEANEIMLPNTEKLIVRFDGHDPAGCAAAVGR